MKGLNKFPPEYFLKYKEKPVTIKPFDPKQETIANIYLNKLKKILSKLDVDITIRGSTLFKISGKGDVELGVYVNEKSWKTVLYRLKTSFGEAENLEIDYARFNSEYKNEEVEIIVLKGHEAEVDRKLHFYLLNHPDILKEYEKVKKKYSYSKREYQIQKNKFLENVIAQIPD